MDGFRWILVLQDTQVGCELGAWDLGNTQHTPYGATLLFTPFPGLKIAGGTQFSPRNAYFIVASNLLFAFIGSF